VEGCFLWDAVNFRRPKRVQGALLFACLRTRALAREREGRRPSRSTRRVEKRPYFHIPLSHVGMKGSLPGIMSRYWGTTRVSQGQ
jgi:hypothetical protein